MGKRQTPLGEFKCQTLIPQLFIEYTCYISCVFISEEESISIDPQFFWLVVHFENLIKVMIQCTSALNPKIRQAHSGVHEISAAHPSSSSQCWECPDSTHWWVKYWRRWEISTNVNFSSLRWILGTFYNFSSLSFFSQGLVYLLPLFSLKLLTSAWAQSKDKPQPSPVVQTLVHKAQESPRLSSGWDGARKTPSLGQISEVLGCAVRGWRYLGDHVIREEQTLTSSEPRMWHKWAKPNKNECDPWPITYLR